MSRKPTQQKTEQISFFTQGLNSATSNETGSIEQFHSQLQSNPAWQQKIEEVRSLSGKDRKSAKESLPVITTSVRITRADGKRRGLRDGDFEHTNLIQADFDDHPEPTELMEQLKADPHTRLVFRSPSGKAKAFFKVAAITTISNHKSAWNTVAAYCESMGYGVIDSQPRAINSLCYISHDPDAQLKDAVPLFWRPTPQPKQTETPKRRNEQIDNDALRAALAVIPADDYQIWIETGMALHHDDTLNDATAFTMWAEWSATSPKFDPDEALRKKWDSFATSSGKGLGSVFHLAKQHGWQPPAKGRDSTPDTPQSDPNAAIRNKIVSLWKVRRTRPQIHDAVKRMPQAQQLTDDQIDALLTEHLPKLPPLSAVTIFNTDFEPVRFAVPNLVPEGLTLLAGPPKIGKSFLCLNLAMAIAAGGVVAGAIPIDQPRRVLYCALEDSPRRIKDRLAMLAPDNNISDRLSFLTQGDLPTVLDDAGISLLDDAVDKNGIEVVIVDTWQRAKPAPTQRNTSTMYDEDYASLGKLQTWALKKRIAVVVVLHTRKTPDLDNPFNQITGSTGIQAGADSMIMLTRRDGSYVLNVIGRDFDDQELGLDFSEGYWTIQGDAKSVFMSQQRKEIVAALAAAEGESLSPKEIGEELGGKNIRQILSAMVKQGSVTKTGRGRYLLNWDDMDDMDDMDDKQPVVLLEKSEDDNQDDNQDPAAAGTAAPKSPIVNVVNNVIHLQQFRKTVVETFKNRTFGIEEIRHQFGESLAAEIIADLDQIVKSGKKIERFSIRKIDNNFKLYK